MHNGEQAEGILVPNIEGSFISHLIFLYFLEK